MPLFLALSFAVLTIVSPLSLAFSLHMTHRSEWSPCTASCGNGIKARTRLYINPDAQGVCDINLVQKATCFGDRPECNPSFYNGSSGAVGGGGWNPNETKGEPRLLHQR